MTIDIDAEGKVIAMWWGKPDGDGGQAMIKKVKCNSLKAFYNKYKKAFE